MNRQRGFYRSIVLSAALASAMLGVNANGLGAPVHLVEQPPETVTTVKPGLFLVDFGRVAFGNLQLAAPPGASGKITVRFGEAMVDGRIDRKPPGSVRYSQVDLALESATPLIVAPAADKRNTAEPSAVLTPAAWGVVTPFRWVEIEGWPGELRAAQVRRRAAFASTWNDKAAAFHSSDEMLNRIWELCRYSIKATTFAGVYVDGDRERTSYEADAFFSQLGQYYTDGDPQMARDTFERLMARPTWPTEWASHMIFMAHADWRQTGDANWLQTHYAALKTKLDLENTRADGLIVSSQAKIKRGDLVDWPAGERDGFVFTPVNTVVNAFHLRALSEMAEMARALHQDADAVRYGALESTARAAFQARLFDPASGLYRDGEGTEHCSLHANLFPLAFNLVPAERRAHLAQWLGDRGMACSVYPAQYLLEALFENDQAAKAIALITAPTDRSWRHMVESGTTITWEAWDQRFKPNQDWTHAWGAAPANLLPRYVLGAQSLTPGWGRANIRPNPGSLQSAEGRVPTPLGPVQIRWDQGETFKLSVGLPVGMSARVELPTGKEATGVFCAGNPTPAHREGSWWIVDKDVTGATSFEVR